MSAEEWLPHNFTGHALVGQRDGRGSKHVIWVNMPFGSRAAAYPPEGICNDETWVSAEPLYTEADMTARLAARLAAVEALAERMGEHEWRLASTDYWHGSLRAALATEADQ